jgi:eukaryotic-like serine/threonine-protein kinase
MLTGHPPFIGDNPLTVLWQHQHQTPASVASVRPTTPPGLDALISRLLAKNPADRPATATEVRDLLVASAESKTVGARPTRAIPVVPQTLTLPVAGRGEEPPAAVGYRFRLGPVGVAAVALGAAIIAVLSVALLIASQGPGTEAATDPPPGTAASTPGTGRSASPSGNASNESTSTGNPPSSATTETFADNPGIGASARLAALRAVIGEQWQAGNLDGDTALELMKRFQEVDHELGDGEAGKAAEKLADLRNKLDEMHRDGKITTAGYDAVSASLTQLAETLPAAEDKRGKGEDED